jgi:hypothetical protein
MTAPTKRVLTYLNCDDVTALEVFAFENTRAMLAMCHRQVPRRKINKTFTRTYWSSCMIQILTHSRCSVSALGRFPAPSPSTKTGKQGRGGRTTLEGEEKGELGCHDGLFLPIWFV